MDVQVYTGDFSNYENWKICFHSAASLGALEVIQRFIESKEVHVDKRNASGWTALMYASSFGHESVVDYLLKNKAHLNLINQDGHTALMLAVISGDAAVVSKLLANNCDLEMKDTQHWTALFHATHLGFDHIVRLLLESGAHINCTETEFGFTPLMLAAMEGLESIVSTFLQHGADMLLKSYSGDTARSLAGCCGHAKVVAMFDRQKCILKGGGIGFALSAVDRLMQMSPIMDKKVSDTNCAQQITTTSNPTFQDLKCFLEFIGLEKYFHVFEEQAVDLSVFLTLNDNDFQEIGIRLLGPRKKMCAAISRWHANAAITNSVEQAYADKLLIDLQKANTKLSLAHKELEKLKSDYIKRQSSNKSQQCNTVQHNQYEEIINGCKTAYIQLLQLDKKFFPDDSNKRVAGSGGSRKGPFLIPPVERSTVNIPFHLHFKKILESLESSLFKKQGLEDNPSQF